GPADAPIVAHSLGRSGLRGGPEREAKRAVGPEGVGAGGGVSEDVADDEGSSGADDLTWIVAKLTCSEEVHRRPFSVVCECSECICLLDQRNFRRTESQAEAVIIAVFDEAVVAQRPETVAELLHIIDEESANCRDVERARERLTDADRPFETVVVILGDIKARGGVKLHRAVIEDRGGGEPAPFDHLRVKMRL